MAKGFLAKRRERALTVTTPGGNDKRLCMHTCGCIHRWSTFRPGLGIHRGTSCRQTEQKQTLQVRACTLFFFKQEYRARVTEPVSPLFLFYSFSSNFHSFARSAALRRSLPAARPSLLYSTLDVKTVWAACTYASGQASCQCAPLDDLCSIRMRFPYFMMHRSPFCPLPDSLFLRERIADFEEKNESRSQCVDAEPMPMMATENVARSFAMIMCGIRWGGGVLAQRASTTSAR